MWATVDDSEDGSDIGVTDEDVTPGDEEVMCVSLELMRKSKGGRFGIRPLASLKELWGFEARGVFKAPNELLLVDVGGSESSSRSVNIVGRTIRDPERGI